MYNLNFLIQLTEKDKRLLVALFIFLIIIFVLIAYIGQGIKALMNRYSKGIDGYMHSLCSARLVTTPKEFRKQVLLKERKVLYGSTRWVFRIFILSMVGFITYTLIVKPSGEGQPLFEYVSHYLGDITLQLSWPKGEFFGIKNFPVDWPTISRTPTFSFTLPAIVSYAMLLVWIITFFGLFTSTLKFIARMNRSRKKSVEVFTQSLDDANFASEE